MTNMFRELSESELEFVSGSGVYINEEVIVNASRSRIVSIGGNWWVVSGGWWGSGYDTGSYDNGGGDDYGFSLTPSMPPLGNLTQCQENQVDNVAWKFTEELRQTGALFSDYEYGTIIYRDSNGAFRHAGLQNSSSRDIVDLKLPAGVSLADVVGYIHTHPANDPTRDHLVDQRPSPDDWTQFNKLSQAIANAGGNVANFRSYIVGPDGIIRQYTSSSSQTQVSNDIVDGEKHC